MGLFVWDEPLCLGMYDELKTGRERKGSVICIQSLKEYRQYRLSYLKARSVF